MKEQLTCKEGPHTNKNNEVEKISDKTKEHHAPPLGLPDVDSVGVPSHLDPLQRGHRRLRGRRGRCQPRALGEQLPADTAQHQGEIKTSWKHSAGHKSRQQV